MKIPRISFVELVILCAMPIFLVMAIGTTCSGMEPAQETYQEVDLTPKTAKEWSDAIGYIFDQWWDRILLILSVLFNVGILSTKHGREGALQAATFNKIKPEEHR